MLHLLHHINLLSLLDTFHLLSRINFSEPWKPATTISQYSLPPINKICKFWDRILEPTTFYWSKKQVLMLDTSSLFYANNFILYNIIIIKLNSFGFPMLTKQDIRVPRCLKTKVTIVEMGNSRKRKKPIKCYNKRIFDVGLQLCVLISSGLFEEYILYIYSSFSINTFTCNFYLYFNS